jgi:hypothetical protein
MFLDQSVQHYFRIKVQGLCKPPLQYALIIKHSMLVNNTGVYNISI